MALRKQSNLTRYYYHRLHIRLNRPSLPWKILHIFMLQFRVSCFRGVSLRAIWCFFLTHAWSIWHFFCYVSHSNVRSWLYVSSHSLNFEPVPGFWIGNSSRSRSYFPFLLKYSPALLSRELESKLTEIVLVVPVRHILLCLSHRPPNEINRSPLKKSLLLIARVNQYWWQVALLTPQLWTTIFISSLWVEGHEAPAQKSSPSLHAQGVADKTTTTHVHDARPRTHRLDDILPPQEDKFDIDEKKELLTLNQQSFEVNIRSLMISNNWWIEREWGWTLNVEHLSYKYMDEGKFNMRVVRCYFYYLTV